jgi:hypothetical protein
MLRSSGRLRFVAVLAFGWAIAWPAAAALCLSDADCATTPLGGIRDCVKSTVFGFELPFGTCSRAGVCNSGRDCIPGAVCELGTCQRPGDAPAGSGGGTPSGSGTPGEGRHCMPADGSKPADWAKDKFGKPLGACPQGTRCNEHGLCVRLET